MEWSIAAWSHTRGRGQDGYVTVIIDLTPVLEGTGRARRLDMVPGRSAAALTSWLANQSLAFCNQVQIVAMDGFGGYKTAATEVLPDATTVMDPFHVVALTGAKLDLCRQTRPAADLRAAAPVILSTVCAAQLRTRYPLLSSRQQARLTAVFADEGHLAVLVSWSVYQRIIPAYAHPDCRRAKTMMTTLIASLRRGLPPGLEEIGQLLGAASYCGWVVR